MVNRSIARFAPGIELPPYAYVPGRSRHPVRDPDGHSFGRGSAPPGPLTEDEWANCDAYLYGIDLFNLGFYWEAHEAWEGLWHSAGRTGEVAAMLNALIVLAAAGVKIREGMPRGARRHATKALSFLRPLAAVHRHFIGLDIRELIAFAERLQDGPILPAGDRQVVLDLVLLPEAGPADSRDD